MNPILLLCCGMAIVVGGILWLRLHPFLAMIVAACGVAMLTPKAELQKFADGRVARGELTAKSAAAFVAKPAAARVAEEFGRTCTNLGILVAMAGILGEAMLLSGAAESIARALLRWLGAARAHWAFFTTSFVLCIPVFFETVFYLLSPLTKVVARQTGKNFLLLVMCTVAGGTITHSLVPPTPGPLFAAQALGVPLGQMILVGTIIGTGAALFGVGFAHFSNRRHTLSIPAEDAAAADAAPHRKLPPLWLALLPVFLPVALIGIEASVEAIPGSALSWILRTFGDKDMAVTLGAFVALLTLARRGGVPQVSKAVQDALTTGAVILLIVGAGGAFGGVLRQTGISETLGAILAGTHFLALPAVFLITALVRTAQGSATVAMITAAPIAKAFIEGGGSHIAPVYLAIAIGCGSKPFPWMNDGGFWIISRLSGLILTMLAAWFVPLGK
jgi:GntP family gluconate:H+ symporter